MFASSILGRRIVRRPVPRGRFGGALTARPGVARIGRRDASDATTTGDDAGFRALVFFVAVSASAATNPPSSRRRRRSSEETPGAGDTRHRLGGKKTEKEG